MSRYYASYTTDKGKVYGSTHAVSAHVRGWTSGVKTIVSKNSNDEDVVEIWVTGGSGNDSPCELIGRVYSTEDGPLFIAAGRTSSNIKAPEELAL